MAIAHQSIEPGQILASNGLQVISRLRDEVHAILEQPLPLREAKPIDQGLDDVEVDPSDPHPRGSPLLGRSADEHRIRVLLLDVFADRNDLREKRPIVEFEAGQPSVGILLPVVRLAILTAHEVDLDEGQIDALLGCEHAHDAGIRSNAVIQSHRGISLRVPDDPYFPNTIGAHRHRAANHWKNRTHFMKTPPTTAEPRGARLFDGLVLIMLSALALAVRLGPTRSMSLWWDEIIHIQTALQDGFYAVYLQAKLGIPAGFGNAGAVPLDYLTLHAWTRIAPWPAAENLEIFFRTPSLIASIGCVLALYLLGRRFFDRGIGLIAAVFLALSISHALYASEARFYSLFGFMTVVNLYTFCALVENRRHWLPWLTFTIVGLLDFSTGLFALLPILVQYVAIFVLLAVDLRDSTPDSARRDRLRLLAPLASGLVILGFVILYFDGTLVGALHGRPARGFDSWQPFAKAFDFFSGRSASVLGLFGLGAVTLLVRGWRAGREDFCIAVVLTAAFLSLFAIVEIERVKQYYFHPRHAFFLLPYFAIVTAAGIAIPLRSLDPLRIGRLSPPWITPLYAGLGLALIIGLSWAPLERHRKWPVFRFNESKTLRDFKGLSSHLERELATLPPDQIYLLLIDRGQQSFTSNTALAKYLQWHGLDDRVVLRGYLKPGQTRRGLVRLCEEGCAGRPASSIERHLQIDHALTPHPEFLRLSGLRRAKLSQRPVGAVGLVEYWRLGRPRPLPASGYRKSDFPGFSLFEIEAEHFSPPADERILPPTGETPDRLS